MKSIMVHITEEDIRNGTRADACGCPIALALARAGGDLVRVGVEQWSASFGDIRYRGEMSETVCQFRKEFDRGLKVTPLDAEFLGEIVTEGFDED